MQDDSAGRRAAALAASLEAAFGASEAGAARGDAAVLAALLPPLARLFLDGALQEAALTHAVQGQMGILCAQDGPLSGASAAALMGTSRRLRHAWTTLGGPQDPGGGAWAARVHRVMDATMESLADLLVHQDALVRQSEAAFSLVIDTIPQLVWRTTPSGEATFANKPFLHHVGRSLEEVLGWGWLEHIHPDDQPRVSQEWARCRAAEREVKVTFRVRGAAGHYRWFLSMGRPFRDPHGALIAYYGTWTDIHAQKEAQEALCAAVTARDAFLCMASHELKTPITALKLQSQLRTRRLTRTPRLDLPHAQFARMVADDTQQVGHLARLVEDMLDVARLDSRRLELRYEPVEWVSFVRAVVERHGPIAQAEGCQVSFLGEGEVAGAADPVRVAQVLGNLLNNACRYAPGSHVVVSVGHDAGAGLIIEVADDGPGIDPERQVRVFERFERGPKPRERSGLGLGLYIVRHLAELMGGEVSLSSERGQGCRFRVHLPTGGAPVAAQAPRSAAAEP